MKPENLPGSDAEMIAISALTFIAGETSRLSRFLNLTGWTQDAIMDPANRRNILVAVLDHLIRDEELLIAFADENELQPEDVPKALRALNER